jgi:uncharacterized protein
MNDPYLDGEITEIHGLTLPDALHQVRIAFHQVRSPLEQVSRLMGQQHFYVKLIPPRPTFPADMTPDERAIMQQHVDYVTGLFAQGKVLIFGPVLDPTYPFGMAVFEVEDESEIQLLMNNDPSVLCGLNQFTVVPMKLGAAQGFRPK